MHSCSQVIKAVRICPVKNSCLGELAQVVLAGIVPNWPADKFLQVYEICVSDEVVKVQQRGDISVQMTRNMIVMINTIDGGGRPITPKTICANGSAVAVVNVGGAVRRYASWYFRSD